MLFAGFDVYQGHAAAGRDDRLGTDRRRARGDDRVHDRLLRAARSGFSAAGAACTCPGAALERANKWFERYGSPAVFFSRLVPVVRSAFPYAAGVGEMPFRRFACFDDARVDPWIVGLAVLGREVGRNWSSWRHHLEYVDYVGLAVVVAAIVYLVVRWRRTRTDARRAGRGCQPPTSGPSASGKAAGLGALHGPAELLPISSSAHITLVPWLLGWDYGELDHELRKAFEVALHAGTAAALLITLRAEVGDAVRAIESATARARRPGVCAAGARRARCSSGRSSAASGRPPTIAAGLLSGAAAMAWADRTPQRAPEPMPALLTPLWLGVGAGVRAGPGRVAQRRDARGRAAARVHARGRQPPVATHGAAGDRRGCRC